MAEIDAFLERANLLLNQGRPKEAEGWIKKVLEVEPENDYAISLLGLCYINNKELDKGIQTIRKAISIDPEKAHYFYLLAFAYYQKNDTYQATVYITQGIEMDPYHAELYGLYAFILLEKKDFKEALKKADEGLAIDAENITCLNARSTALNKLRMTDEAIATMQNALAQDPDNEFTHATIGWNYLEKGKHRLATKHFREALRIAPGHQNAKTGLKEALKSKIAPYRWLLQFNYWLQNKGKNFRWGFLIALFIGVRLIATISKNNPETESIGLMVAGAYLLFVATSWIINPLANAFLLFHKDGKYALDNSEKWNAIAFMSCVLFGIVLLTLAFVLPLSKDMSGNYLAMTGIAFSLSIPCGHMQFPLRLKGNKLSQWIAMGLLLIGAMAIIAGFIAAPSVEIYFVAYFVLFVIYTWTSAF